MLRQLLKDIDTKQYESTVLLCDNAAAQKLIQNPIFHKRLKHIDVKFHYTRDLIKQKIIDVQHISTQLQFADILTKPLTRIKFETNRDQLNII